MEYWWLDKFGHNFTTKQILQMAGYKVDKFGFANYLILNMFY